MRSFIFTNDESRPITVWLEPWAHDFTLLIKETIQISTSEELDFDLSLERSERDLIVYIESNHDIESIDININGKTAKLGHQREYSGTT